MASSSMDKNALIVDDTASLRQVSMAVARKCGFKTTSATNGQEAVELYESGKRFSLIIMDMEMPIMDGIEATRTLRSMGADCLIIGATACEDESKKNMFKEAGLDHLINKPVTKQKLDQLIN